MKTNYNRIVGSLQEARTQLQTELKRVEVALRALEPVVDNIAAAGDASIVTDSNAGTPVTGAKQSERITQVLAEVPGRAMLTRQIADITGISRQSCQQTLGVLKRDGKIRHATGKGYWMEAPATETATAESGSNAFTQPIAATAAAGKSARASN